MAHAVPMVVFVCSLALVSPLKKFGGPFSLRYPEYWLYPLQTIGCGILLAYFWQRYRLHRIARVCFTVAIAVFVFLLWISPQCFFGFAPRTDGFNPDVVASNLAFYWATVGFRFLRLVVVVPLVEEIFWRGFLLRYCIDEHFERVPFGAFSWISFAVVTVAFTFVHSPADWIAAAITGALYNCVAYRTKSLSSCILAHALTNLLLGVWIMATKQWGFW
ncbi:MAG: CAAX prenyl protease-related protein [Verrucomicrobiota bacterium]|nr:CAAX prenyl protease-related protein [Verrucomicrobiota bacterium]